MDRELWRWVVGYEGLYLVSSHGKIMSVPHAYKDGLIMKPRESSNGYMFVSLFKDGSYKRMSIHRVVAQAFIPNPEHKEQVNHLDGNKTNNNVSNLEWATCSENMQHKIYTLHKRHGPGKGSKSKLRRFTDDEVRAIRADKRKPSVICLDYGVTRQCISDVQKGKFYKEVV